LAGKGKKVARRQPITRHALFPATVALWFGALFGLGSLAIRPSLLEQVVVAGGIDLIVPAAAPPLGMTARILLALAMGVTGSMLGLVLGARIARPKAELVQRRRTSLKKEEPAKPRRADRFTQSEGEPPKPFSAFDEVGQDVPIGSARAEPASGKRRRALALAEPIGPDYACDRAPLPGGDYEPLPIPDGLDGVFDLSEALAVEPVEEEFLPEVTPFTPVHPVQSEAIEQPVDAPETVDERKLPPQDFGKRFAGPKDGAAVDPAIKAPAAPLFSAAAVQASGTDAAKHLRSAPLESLSHVELIERLALSVQDRRNSAALAAAAAAAVKPAQLPPKAEGFAFAAPTSASAMPRFGFEPREPVEPLGFAPGTFTAESPLPSFSAVQTAITTETAPEARAQIAPEAPPAVPASLRPIDLGDAPLDEDDIIPRFPFPPSAPTPGQSAIAPATDEAGDDEILDDSPFSSLLAPGRGLTRPPLIRIEEPVAEDEPIEPVVIFPGHGSRPFAAPPPAAAVAPEPRAVVTPTALGPRPFDAPGNTATAPAPAAPVGQAAAPRQDAEETERALRTALATLQRMSGAA